MAFFPHNFPMLRTSSVDAETDAALDIITTLQNPSPASSFGSNPNLCALHKLAEISKTAFEYMRLPINIIPDEIIEQYNLLPLVVNESIYIEIQKGMYGLPQAGKIAYDRLRKHLLQHGYSPLHSLLVYGDTHIARLPSPLSSMILVLNPKIFSIQITSTMHFAISKPS